MTYHSSRNTAEIPNAGRSGESRARPLSRRAAMMATLLAAGGALSVRASTAQAAETDLQARVDALTLQQRLAGIYRRFDYTVAELVEMQSLALLEGFSGHEPESDYRSGYTKLKDWLPNTQGSIKRLYRSYSSIDGVATADAEVFAAAQSVFAGFVESGKSVAALLESGDPQAAYQEFLKNALPLGKQMRGTMYTLISAADSAFAKALKTD